MAQASHVPKFGNWDKDTIPYTNYFENARKDKSGGRNRMNPNDPEENPEAFMLASDQYQYQAARKPQVDQKHQDRNRMRQRNNSYDDPKSRSESGSERSSSDHRAMKLNKNKSQATTSFDARKKRGVPETRRGTSVPKFGTWDEKDPASGDGFTVIFNKVKEEKHNPSANFPTPPQHNTHSNTHHKHHGTSSMSKICCSIL